MSKKPTKQSRATARRKARQERAIEAFRKWYIGRQRRHGLSARDLRGYLFTVGVPFRDLPQRSKQKLVEDFG